MTLVVPRWLSLVDMLVAHLNVAWIEGFTPHMTLLHVPSTAALLGAAQTEG